MVSYKIRLQEIILREGLIEPENLNKALKEQKKLGGDLGKILIKMQYISEHNLIQVLSESLGLPSIKISRMSITSEVIDCINKNVAQKYRVIPISIIGNNLSIVMADPLDMFAIDNLQALTEFNILPVLAESEEINAAIKKYYLQGEQEEVDTLKSFHEIMKDMQDNEDMELVKTIGIETKKGEIEEITDQAPIIKLTDTIISQAVAAKASDVFIEPLEKAVRIRYRVDGVIREIDRISKVLHYPLISRIKVISNLDISEHRLPQDGRFKTVISGNRSVDFRVNVLPTALGEKIVLRVLDQSTSFLDIEKLGFEENSLKRLKECSIKPHGLILTCGPTGSGKTTTLYSILNYVDSPGKNLVTVEDPVEYQVKGLNQVNIRPQVGLTFPSSLRSILRQDPDVILIGEIRDPDTLDIAVKAALTGHLVLSSLHTTTAAGSIVRMMNMGVEPFLICSSVLAIVAQRLIRKVCPKCKEEYDLPPSIIKKIGLDKMIEGKEIKVFRGKGCPDCLNTGYKGRVGITEILIFSPSIKELILKRVGEFSIKQQARKEGMRTMREDGLAKVIEGLTSIEEVVRVTAPDE